MKKQTKIIFGSLLAILIMSAPLAAQAKPFGHGGGNGYGHQNGSYGPGHQYGWYQSLSPEKQQAVSVIFNEHRTKVEPIREQLWIKNRTLDALSSNAKAEPKEITALIEEIAALRKQMRTERVALADRIKKETGIEMPMGKGYGGYGRHDRKGGGYHNGYGRGCR